MAQHDFNIANQTFPNFRSDLNDALQAAGTISAGSSAPTTTYAYQLWFDTSANTYKIRNAANSAWVSVLGNDLTNAGINTEKLTVTGDLTVDTNTLKVDSTNNRVGIGTAVLNNPLHIVLTPNTASKTSGSAFDDGAVRLEGSLNATDAETAILVGNNDSLSAGIGFARENSATWGTQLRFYNHSPSITTTDELTERMRIDATGRLGLGTASPSAHLQVETSTNSPVLLKSTHATGGYVEYQLGASGASIGYIGCSNALINTGGTESLTDLAIRSQGSLVFSASGNDEKMRINSSGSLLVGITSGEVRNANDLGVSVEAAGRIYLGRGSSSGAFAHLVFINSNGTVGSVTTSGSSTAYNTSSDYRLKENVTYDWDSTTRLKQLKPARFNFIADADTTVDGFLAHEVQDIVPESVTGEKDAMKDEEYVVSAATGDIYTPAAEATFDDDGNEVSEATDEVIHKTNAEKPEELTEGQQWRETTAAKMGTRSVPDYQGIDQSKLVPLLVKTIQELEARITALEAG